MPTDAAAVPDPAEVRRRARTAEALALSRRVAKGAALLDRARPGWYREIAADRLAMENCYRCILGQLHGDYFDGLDELVLSVGSGVGLGFDLHVVDATRENYAALADAWRGAIRERLAGEDA